jgi:hypothetical protein
MPDLHCAARNLHLPRRAFRPRRTRTIRRACAAVNSPLTTL